MPPESSLGKGAQKKERPQQVVCYNGLEWGHRKESGDHLSDSLVCVCVSDRFLRSV